MPRGLMDDLEGEVVDEKVHEGGLWEDIFAADLYCEDALLTNIGEHRVRSVADDLGGFVGSEGIVSVKESFVLLFKFALGISLCLVDHRFW